jgi:uncharacterized LabA/DUF88 family protein
MVADDLRRQADQFVDLNDLKPEIGRDMNEREARRSERAAPEQSDEFEDFANI